MLPITQCNSSFRTLVQARTVRHPHSLERFFWRPPPEKLHHRNVGACAVFVVDIDGLLFANRLIPKDGSHCLLLLSFRKFLPSISSRALRSAPADPWSTRLTKLFRNSYVNSNWAETGCFWRKSCPILCYRSTASLIVCRLRQCLSFGHLFMYLYRQ